MGLSQRLCVFTFGSTLLMIFVIASLLLSSKAVNLSLQRFDYAQKVGILADHLSQHINNYSNNKNTHNLRNDKEQWLADHKRLSETLSTVPVLTPQMKIQQNSIVSKNNSMLILFNHISTFEIDPTTHQVKAHLIERLLIQIESIKEDSQQLSAIVRNDTQQMIKQQLYSTTFVLTVGTLGLIWGLLIVNRLFKSSIRDVQRGITEINAGNYGKIELAEESNEFASVIKKFNEMSEQLQKTTISRDSLQKIVDERTKELVLLSNTDPLTNVANRRALFERGPLEFARAERYSCKLSVLLLDCDFFKRINDEYGHLAGDKVLQHLSKTCLNEIREIDFVARYGGEEFVILLPHCDAESARSQAKRIQQALSNNSVPINDKLIEMTVSIGIATINENHQCFEEMVNEADDAMYSAKKNGRNRIEMAPFKQVKQN